MSKDLYIDSIKVKLKRPIPKDDVIPYAKGTANEVFEDIKELYLDGYMESDVRLALKQFIGPWNDMKDLCDMLKDKLEKKVMEMADTFISMLNWGGELKLALVGGDAYIDDMLMTPHYIMFTLIDRLKDASILDKNVINTVWVDADMYGLKSVVSVIKNKI